MRASAASAYPAADAGNARLASPKIRFAPLRTSWRRAITEE
jgi:hypothetical protein